LDREDEPEPEARISLHFADLILDWTDGAISATRLQRHAATFLQDGNAHPMATRLASIGADNHAQSGMRRLLESYGVPQLLTRYPGEAATDVMLPSAWLRLLHAYTHEFRLRLGAEVGKLRAFWSKFLLRPATRHIAATHPILVGLGVDALANMVPLTLHTDAAPASKEKSCVCISFASLLGTGDEKLTRFVCATYLKERGVDDAAAWTHILGDLEKLASKAQPVIQDPDGTVWTFVVLFMKSDEEVRCNETGMPSYSSATEVCSECMSNRTTRPFTDMSATALWRPTEQMPFATYRERLAEPLHPLARSHLFSHRCFFYLDLMHLCDCKGVAALTFGGVLSHLLSDPRLGPNRQARLDVVNTELRAFQDAHPGMHRLPQLRLANAVADTWANLNGRVIKAANTRSAAPFFNALVFRHFPGGSAVEVSLRGVVAALDGIYKVIYSQPMFMAGAKVVELRRNCVSFGEHYMRLRELARRENRFAWPVTPKVHKLQHVPMFATVLNPRFVQNYAEESTMGTMQRTWRRSMAGRYQGSVQANVLSKRVTALLIRFEQGM